MAAAWFNDRPVLFKVAAAPIIGLLCLLAVGAGTYVTIDRLSDLRQDIRDGAFLPYQRAAQVQNAALDLYAQLFRVATMAATSGSGGLAGEADLLALRADKLAALRDFAPDGVRGDLDTYVSSARDVIATLRSDASLALVLMSSVEFAYTGLASGLTDATARADRQGGELYAVAEAESRTAVQVFSLAISLFLLGGIAVTVILSRAISRPILDMTQAMGQLAAGNLRISLDGARRQDEIGAMAKALAVFRDALVAAEAMRREQDRQTQLRESRGRDLDKAMRDFQARIGDIVAAVTQAAERLQADAGTMLEDAERTRAHTLAGGEEARRTAGSVETVAAAASQLSASIDEIDRRMRQTATVSGDAAASAGQAGESMRKVVQSSRQIEDVLRLISMIAGQTHLLALNATIEAARAGDAGKGFVVVADEVKHLAHRTATATEDIAAQIAAMRDVTDGAAQAVDGIVDVVGQIGAMAQDMSVAVDQQGAATRDIAQGAEAAALATRGVDSAMDQVAAASAASRDTAQSVLASARMLTDQADHLRGEIVSFLAHVADSGLHSTDEPFIDRVMQQAQNVAAALEQAVERGELGEDDLFDRDYQPIAGTEPAQVGTRALAVLERLLPPLQDPVLDFDPRVVFCVAVDGNGYLPVHNPAFAAPQGSDPVWNDAHCRNRRIFDDPTGLDAARNTQPFLLQTYRRAMGGGQYVMMKDASAPVFVRGRHWGALRLGYRISDA